MSWKRWSRKLHRWGAILTAVPLLIVIASGILLQMKKQVTWVQPPTMKGVSKDPGLNWDQILEAAKSVPEAQIQSWKDIDRLDVRPKKKMLKVQAKNRWEIQIDWGTGQVLSSTYRRSDLIESLHDGSFFGDIWKDYFFLANGLVLFGLWFTGLYLWYLPFQVKAQKKKRKANQSDSIG